MSACEFSPVFRRLRHDGEASACPEATVLVGGAHLLCANCAALPEFTRITKRPYQTQLRRPYEPSHPDRFFPIAVAA